jgi:GINS complex subunit 2
VISAMDGVKDVVAGQLALQKAEFLAEDELIEISPMVKANVISLVCGDYGPFEPSIATSVPLWLALALKKVRRCRILPPRWLHLRAIEQVIQDERENDSQLRPLPRYFSEVRQRGRVGVESAYILSPRKAVLHEKRC